jgi:hypothetical protein
MWNIPEDVVDVIKRYAGENKPSILDPKDKRRMFANEFSDEEKAITMQWLYDNKTLIISDILKGRGQFAAEWMLVTLKLKTNIQWVIKPMNIAINHYSQGEVLITKRGNFVIGRITMQRKEGDDGRPTGNMLQFKINPAELFNL